FVATPAVNQAVPSPATAMLPPVRSVGTPDAATPMLVMVGGPLEVGGCAGAGAGTGAGAGVGAGAFTCPGGRSTALLPASTCVPSLPPPQATRVAASARAVRRIALGTMRRLL